MPEQPAERFPRPLTERERAVLEFLLAADAPGIDELRRQAATASVVGRCTCGCATIDLAVDRSQHRAATSTRSPAIEARTELTEDADRSLELLLFVDDGWLASVEIVYYGAEPPREFPPPEAFQPPYASPSA